jgi:hypothetical protein
MPDQTNIIPDHNVTGFTASAVSGPVEVASDLPSPAVTDQPPSQGWALGLTGVTGLLRLGLQGWVPGFSPVGALGLFGGGRLRSWQAWLLPLLVMIATDALLAGPLARRGYQAIGPMTPFIYSSFLLYVLLGRRLCRKNSLVRIGLASLLGSLQFYLVTNFGFWLLDDGVTFPGPTYPRNLTGLGMCYLAGLPFLNRTVLGDLFFSTAVFGAYALVSRLAAAPKTKLAS